METKDIICYLLDAEAEYSNDIYYIQKKINTMKRIIEFRNCQLDNIREKIRELRQKETPVCFGTDDCSSAMLSICPYRFDCREE